MHREYDVVLINPGNPSATYQHLSVEFSALEPPTFTALVARHLQLRELRVALIDIPSESDSIEEIAQRVADFNPYLVGVFVYGYQPSASTQNMPAAQSIIDALRNIDPSIKIMLSGTHPASLPERTLEETGVDYVCDREGFATTRELVECLKVSGNLKKVPDLWIIEDGKPSFTHRGASLPKNGLEYIVDRPAWDLLDMGRYRSHNWHSLSDLSKRQPYASIYTSLDCPFSCVSENTMVGTSQGLLKFNELEFDENYICPEGHEHNISKFENVTIVSNGIKNVFEVVLENNVSFELTKDHPILSVSEENLVFKNISELCVGDYVALECDYNSVSEYVILDTNIFHGNNYNTKEVIIPNKLTEDLAWLIGFLLGDGCIPKDKRGAIHFAVIDQTENLVVDKMKSVFGIDGSLYDASNTKKMKHLWYYSTAVMNFFIESIGISPENKLHIPESIRRSPKSVVLSFIDGLFSADGYVPKQGHRYISTSSKEFAQEISNLCLWIGLGTSLYKGTLSTLGVSEPWRVVICDESCITHDPNNKIGIGCWTKRIPINKRLYKNKLGKLLWRTLGDKYRNGIKRSMLYEKNHNHPLIEKKYIYVPIKEINEIGRKPVYDLNVPEKQMFTANGVVVHNCSFCCIAAPFGKAGYWTWDSTTVVDQIEMLVRKYGVHNIKIVDEMFLMNETHVLGIANEIIKRGLGDLINIWFYGRVDVTGKLDVRNPALLETMQRAGFRWIALGIESASEFVRDGQDKKYSNSDIIDVVRTIQNSGMYVIGNFIFGLPDDTLETMQATLNMALELRAEWVNMYSGMAYPGSKLHRDLRGTGILPEENEAGWIGYSQHTYETFPLPTATLSNAEVLKFRDEAFLKYFTDDAYVASIQKKFGDDAVSHIKKMANLPHLRRKLLESA